MTTRHIMLSEERGMVTELEMVDGGFSEGQEYMLRYRQTTPGSGAFEISVPDTMPLLGFRYRNNELSILLLSQGQLSAAA